MKIGIVGSGNVGKALAENFGRAGLEVSLGTRSPHDPISLGQNVKLTSIAESIKDQKFVFLAIPWSAVATFCEENKMLSANIVDCTNPLKPRLGGLEHDDGKSGAEKIADWLPNSKVIKSFNQTGAENMREPIDRPLMLFSTDHEDLIKDFMSLLESTGFDGRYAGPLNSSIYLEYLAITWIHLAIRTELGRNFSFHIAEGQK